MAYTLKKSDGSILVVLPDQQSDTESTSLTLIGKNVNAYGTDINQNYIRHLENFAYTVAPSNPLTGQLWYDTVEQRIKVYTINNEFKPVGSPTISPTKPSTLAIGDLWYDSKANQLKFVDASNNVVVIGPMYDTTVGKSGWVTEEFLTNTNSTQTVSSLYSNDVMLGLLSEASSKTLNSTLTSITSLNPGIILRWDSSVKAKFYGTATTAEALVKSDGVTKVYADALLNTGSTISTYSPINIYSDDPTGSLAIGPTKDFQFYTTNSTSTTATLYLANLNADYDISVNPKDLSGETSVLRFTSNNYSGARLGIFNTAPTERVDIIGNVKIQGDLIVYGTSTYIQSQDLKVIDKNIELAVVDIPTNDTADGGGIIVRSSGYSSSGSPTLAAVPPRNKEIAWYLSSPNGVVNAWSITDNVELRFGDSMYYIRGEAVLSQTALQAIVTGSNLTSVGNLTTLNVGNLNITTSTIGVRVAQTPIIIGDTNTSEIQFSGKKLFNALSPTGDDPDSTVATKGYVRDKINAITNGNAGLTIDVTGHAGSSIDGEIDRFVTDECLPYLFPIGTGDWDSPPGTLVRVLCVRYTTAPLLQVPSDYFDFIPVTVDKNTVPEAASVVLYAPGTYRVKTDFPAADLGVDRVIKQYIANNLNEWTAYPSGPVANIIKTFGTW